MPIVTHVNHDGEHPDIFSVVLHEASLCMWARKGTRMGEHVMLESVVVCHSFYVVALFTTTTISTTGPDLLCPGPDLLCSTVFHF